MTSADQRCSSAELSTAEAGGEGRVTCGRSPGHRYTTVTPLPPAPQGHPRKHRAVRRNINAQRWYMIGRGLGSTAAPCAIAVERVRSTLAFHTKPNVKHFDDPMAELWPAAFIAAAHWLPPTSNPAPEREGGGGVWNSKVQKVVYQKQPNQYFLL